MNTDMSIQIIRYDTGWMSIACDRCRIIIWQGEEVWWIMAKLTAMDLISFFTKHQCRSAS